jgi:putative endonuclease
MNKRFFVYVLSNRRRGVLYVGVTSDLIRRLLEHKAKLVPGFTKTYGIVMLVYYEEYSSILEARAREATLKRWRRAWKMELIDKFNPDWRDLAEELALYPCSGHAADLVLLSRMRCSAKRLRSGAALIRDRSRLGVLNGPGSAAQHSALARSMLRCARDTTSAL